MMANTVGQSVLICPGKEFYGRLHPQYAFPENPRRRRLGGICFVYGTTLTLLFRAECSKCIILDRCENWIHDEILRDLGKDVIVKGIRKKPFFWDTVV